MTTNARLNEHGDAERGAWKLEACISSDAQECCGVIRQLVRHLENERWSESEIFGIHLSLEEAVANALHHGNGQDRGKSIYIKLETTPDTFYAQITDEGCGFDPGLVPDPTVGENRDLPCGRGLMLMRCYMDRVRHSASGNSVELFKQRSR